MPDDTPWPKPPPPLPTVTLAEIYAAQGHLDRAIKVLDEVLVREPDHREARTLRTRFAEQARARLRSSQNAEPEVMQPSGVKTEPPIEAPEPPIGTPERHQDVSATPAGLSPSSSEAITTREPPAPLAAEPAPPVHEEPVAVVVDPNALGEAALPERYGVDEIVAITVNPHTVYLYWEVRATTLARTQALQPEGSLCIRVACVIPSWNGPAIETRDLYIDALYGDLFVHDLKPGSNVRVSVGWKTDETFDPFAVGVEVTTPRLVPFQSVSLDVARWEPEGGPLSQTHQSNLLSGAMDASYPYGSAKGEAPSPQEDAAFRAPDARRATATDTSIETWGGESALESNELASNEEEEHSFGGASELGRRRASSPRSNEEQHSFGGASELGRERSNRSSTVMVNHTTPLGSSVAVA